MEPAQAGGGLLSRVFLLDGCTRRLPHTAELLKAYPAGRNQQLVIRILVAHHLGSGLAVRPCWGPLYGGEAVSEQRLTEQILERLPAEAVLMADRNFAVFSVAWAAPHTITVCCSASPRSERAGSPARYCLRPDANAA